MVLKLLLKVLKNSQHKKLNKYFGFLLLCKSCKQYKMYGLLAGLLASLSIAHDNAVHQTLSSNASSFPQIKHGHLLHECCLIWYFDLDAETFVESIKLQIIHQPHPIHTGKLALKRWQKPVAGIYQLGFTDIVHGCLCKCICLCLTQVLLLIFT